MHYIDKIKQFFPPYYRCKKNFWLAKTIDVKLPANKKIFIFLAANYGNLGDVAITIAQHKLLHYWKPDCSIVEVPSNCSYSFLKSVVKLIDVNDIVTFVGGGNMGDMYPLYENLRQIIISELPYNKIIQFPITADFSPNNEGPKMLRYAKKIYGVHKKIRILARESKTAEFLSNLLNKNISIVPDVVLTLDYFKQDNHRDGFALCLRNDKEKVLTNQETETMKSVLIDCKQTIEYTDTIVDDQLITLENKEMFLNRLLSRFAKKKMIITDRLHGMIFAYITGTPAIVFSNSNGKVGRCYEWIKDCGYVFYMNSFNRQMFMENIKQAMLITPNKQHFDEKRKLFVKEILSAL